MHRVTRGSRRASLISWGGNVPTQLVRNITEGTFFHNHLVRAHSQELPDDFDSAFIACLAILFHQ